MLAEGSTVVFNVKLDDSKLPGSEHAGVVIYTILDRFRKRARHRCEFGQTRLMIYERKRLLRGSEAFSSPRDTHTPLIMTGAHQEAANDCLKATSLDPKFIKVFMSRVNLRAGLTNS